MLNSIMLNVVMLNVVSPIESYLILNLKTHHFTFSFIVKGREHQKKLFKKYLSKNEHFKWYL
jgi:hypothetical protein